MKPRSLFLCCLIGSLWAFAVVRVAHAAPPSDPVGALRLVLRGGSDTVVSLPLHRPALIETSVASRSGSQLTLSTTIASLPAEGAFALVMSGTMEGAVLPVTALSGSTVTVDAAGYDLATLQTVAGNGSGATVALIPYWTLGTVFPAGAGVYASTDILAVQTQILMFDDSIAGINFSTSATYFYYSGDSFFSAGWYRFGDMSATRGNTRIPPQRYFIARHPVGKANTELMVCGQVQMSGARIGLATRAAGRAQDNLFALPVSVPVTLANSRLKESGAFAPTTDILSVKDQLLFFNNTAVGVNKSASAVYFYYAGDSFFAAGWYRFGDMSQTVGNVLLKPGEGYIVRKSAPTTPQTNFWNLTPSYLQ